MFHFVRALVQTLLILSVFVASMHAQEVSIPDPGLNGAVRDALQKPNGPLTEQDMLGLTNLNARNRNVESIEGLETARNLVVLDLQINQLANFSLPSALTNLSALDLSVNPLTNFSLPSGLTNLTSLAIEAAGLTNLTLPSGLTRLSKLNVENNQLTSFDQLSNLPSLVTLNLGFNSFTNFSLPGELTNLRTFYFAGNPITNVTLPPGLMGMTELNLSQNLLISFTLPEGMTNLIELDLAFNQLTNLTLPDDLWHLTTLDLDFNRPDLHAVRYLDPRIASHLKRIHRVRNHRSTNSEVIIGDRVGNAIPRILERLANDSGSKDGLFHRIDTQEHCADVTSQLPCYGRLPNARQATKDNQHRPEPATCLWFFHHHAIVPGWSTRKPPGPRASPPGRTATRLVDISDTCWGRKTLTVI